MPLPDLVEALQRRTLALFIGADLPRQVTGLPSRADLARELARRRGLDESLPLAEVAQRVERAGNRWEFAAFIRDALDTAGKSPQLFHRRIVALVQTHQIETLITTAYDNLLELAFQQAGVGLNRVVSGGDVSFINPDRPTLVKLYGDAGRPDTLVVADRDHLELLRDRKREPLLDEVRRALRRNTMLFLGYNLADPDFRFLFDQIAESRFARTAYAIWPGLAEADVGMWRDRGIVILDEDPLGILSEAGVQSAPVAHPGPARPASVPSPPATGANMDYERGLQALRECLAGAGAAAQSELATLEERLANNQRAERLFGSSENTRNERSQIIYALNELALSHCGVSFNDLCRGAQPTPPMNDAERERLQRTLEMARRALTILEEQAAGFGKLHIPAHLRIELEEKRREVADLEVRLRGAGPTAYTEPRAPEERVPESYFDVQIRIHGFDLEAQVYPVEARLGNGSHFGGGALRLDQRDLLAAELDARAYGLALFEALFHGPILRAYDRATTYAETQTGGRLRMRLWIDSDAAELHALAWERLHHPVEGVPLPIATSSGIPFSRYIGLEQREPPPITERPARMLFAISNPTNLADYGLAFLDVEEEIENLLDALGDLRQAGQLQVALMPGRSGLSEAWRSRLEREGYRVLDGITSTTSLVRALSDPGGYHILHYLGHGRFDRSRQQAALLFEREDDGARGSAEPVRDEALATLLKSAGTLPHLVFLAACESARRDPRAGNPFVGLAPRLIQVGVPAVVAMQDLIPVATARRLTHGFYSYLLRHGTVDRAMSQARLLLFEPGRSDWAIPALFMRLKDGQLFG